MYLTLVLFCSDLGIYIVRAKCVFASTYLCSVLYCYLVNCAYLYVCVYGCPRKFRFFVVCTHGEIFFSFLLFFFSSTNMKIRTNLLLQQNSFVQPQIGHFTTFYWGQSRNTCYVIYYYIQRYHTYAAHAWKNISLNKNVISKFFFPNIHCVLPWTFLYFKI